MLEKSDKPSMRTLLIDAGILKVGSSSSPQSITEAPDTVAVVAEVHKPLSLAERLAQKAKNT
jgi:hypothetical protein